MPPPHPEVVGVLRVIGIGFATHLDSRRNPSAHKRTSSISRREPLRLVVQVECVQKPMAKYICIVFPGTGHALLLFIEGQEPAWG